MLKICTKCKQEVEFVLFPKYKAIPVHLFNDFLNRENPIYTIDIIGYCPKCKHYNGHQKQTTNIETLRLKTEESINNFLKS